MTRATLMARRLAAQQLDRPAFATPGELVSWLGAVQAQDSGAARWAVGLRLPEAVGATDARIEEAIAGGAVVRTHALRGTWQLLAPADVRWLLALVAPRLLARSATRYRQLELDAATFRRSHAALARALRGGDHLTRPELGAALRAAGVSTAGQRLPHLLQRAELEALICGGARRGKQPTWALLDRLVPGGSAPLPPEEALAELAGRYFRSRGPATVADFAWWSGLGPAEARAGLEAVRSTLASEVMDGRTLWRSRQARAAAGAATTAHFLPAFDEYLIAYRDRDAVLDPGQVKRLNAGGGLLSPCLAVGGRVIGTWKRVLKRGAVTLQLRTFEKPGPGEREAIAAAARRYGAFLGLEAKVS